MSNTWVRVLSRARASRNASDDLVAVVADLHVDEVDDDDAADVAQAQLAGDLVGGLEVVPEHGLLEVRSPDVLAGVHVDDGERLGALDDERAAGRQPHLAVERLQQLLVHVVSLEQREPLDLLVVVLDALGELRRDRLDVRLDLLVERGVVDEHAAVLLGELLAEQAQDERGLLVQEPRGSSTARRAPRSAPTADGAGACRARARPALAPSAAVRTISPASGGRRPSRIRRSRLRSSSGSRFEMPYVLGWPGTMHDEAAGEAHLLGEPRALGADRVLGDLHHHVLAVLQQRSIFGCWPSISPRSNVTSPR